MALMVFSRICVMSSAHWKKDCHNKRRGECGWEQRRRCIFSRGGDAVISTTGGIYENTRISANSAKRNGSYVYALCRCPRWSLKEVITFTHWPATTGLHCRQQGRSWNPVLSARRLLDRNGLQTPFWPGLLHIWNTLTSTLATKCQRSWWTASTQL